ncbi:Uncharacterised protein [Mycobacteroides abscessus subsp. abscessus]|uniref:hypothetical protein n=1 Tax=Mycobacteroides abscessus TaxID=36809 RepID=UPI000929D85D|nr:hypothetical protein [Mycobacteroides abscessus]SHS17798.1 Uncharacterised protein [Mycobacteroides abscessus subsp. abscessus]SKO03837.1 Uncharacterised protein [Mycobacteroides abscessus subsp. massiliense]
MTAKAAARTTTPAKRNWRHYENRKANKYFGKRLTDADHKAIQDYADSLGVKMSALIAPAIDEILQKAHAHADTTSESGTDTSMVLAS